MKSFDVLLTEVEADFSSLPPSCAWCHNELGEYPHETHIGPMHPTCTDAYNEQMGGMRVFAFAACCALVFIFMVGVCLL